MISNILDFLPYLWTGMIVTLQLTLGGIALAIAMSFTAGLAKLSKFFPLRWLAIGYIEVFRGTSALVQLFWVFYVLPFFGVNVNALVAGIAVLGLNAGSYGAEVVRGAIQAVPKGQYEAATALNFTPLQRLWRIVIPQAVVGMIPPLGNIFIELMKATALVSLITLSELTFVARQIRDETQRTTEVFLTVLVLYFILALAITFVMRAAEWWMSRGLDQGGVR